MEVYSLSFIYLVLPVSVLVCAALPVRRRPILLLLLSAVLYFCLEREYLVLPVAVVAFDYVMVRLMEYSGALKGLRRLVMICSVVKSVGLIVLYGVLGQVYGVHIPLGLGVYCLTSAGYVIDCYCGYAPYEHNPVEFMLMTLFFPKLYAGPLVYYSKMMLQLRSPKMSLQKIGDGLQLFIWGLAKKVILGDTTWRVFRSLKRIPLYEATPFSSWMMVITLALSVYLLFSGLCDMAKGVGLAFGFELPDNYNYPYRATSVNDFFSRFNLTVNRFIRRYVYINLGGAEGGVASGVFNILLVTILMGLWFGINLNMMAWGIYLALFVIFERYFLRRYMDQIPTLFKWVYTAAVVLVSFAFFAGGSLRDSLGYLKVMFTGVQAMGPHDNDEVLYLLLSNFLVLGLGALCSLGMFDGLNRLFKKGFPRIWRVLSAVLSIALLAVSTAYIL